jgi:hypothetical protein
VVARTTRPPPQSRCVSQIQSLTRSDRSRHEPASSHSHHSSRPGTAAVVCPSDFEDCQGEVAGSSLMMSFVSPDPHPGGSISITTALEPAKKPHAWQRNNSDIVKYACWTRSRRCMKFGIMHGCWEIVVATVTVVVHTSAGFSTYSTAACGIQRFTITHRVCTATASHMSFHAMHIYMIYLYIPRYTYN